MPKRRYINARYYLERIFTRQREIIERQADLRKEWVELEAQRLLLEDRAEVLTAYDWQSRHHFPLVTELRLLNRIKGAIRPNAL